MDLVINILAVFYLLMALMKSAGPWNIFSLISRALPDCAICLSFWFGLGVVVFLQVLGVPYIREILAVAGGATILYIWLDAQTAFIEV